MTSSQQSPTISAKFPYEKQAFLDVFYHRTSQAAGDGVKVRRVRVTSGHIIRMIEARWNGMPPAAGRVFFCRPASVGVLGFEHDRRDQPIIRLWNYVSEPRE